MLPNEPFRENKDEGVAGLHPPLQLGVFELDVETPEIGYVDPGECVYGGVARPSGGGTARRSEVIR